VVDLTPTNPLPASPRAVSVDPGRPGGGVRLTQARRRFLEAAVAAGDTWLTGYPPGEFYPEMTTHYEVVFSPTGRAWHHLTPAGRAAVAGTDSGG
jgi:hypothetical protein